MCGNERSVHVLEFKSLQECIHFRMTANPEQYYDETLWNTEILMFCSQPEDSLSFITNVCTDEELWWLGEVYEDIIEKMQDVRILNALKERAEKVQDSKLKEDILSDIQDAERFLIHNT